MVVSPRVTEALGILHVSLKIYVFNSSRVPTPEFATDAVFSEAVIVLLIVQHARIQRGTGSLWTPPPPS